MGGSVKTSASNYISSSSDDDQIPQRRQKQLSAKHKLSVQKSLSSSRQKLSIQRSLDLPNEGITNPSFAIVEEDIEEEPLAGAPVKPVVVSSPQEENRVSVVQVEDHRDSLNKGSNTPRPQRKKKT